MNPEWGDASVLEAMSLWSFPDGCYHDAGNLRMNLRLPLPHLKPCVDPSEALAENCLGS